MNVTLPPPYDQINFYPSPCSSNTVVTVDYKLRRPSVSFLDRVDMPFHPNAISSSNNRRTLLNTHLSDSYALPTDIRFPTPPPPYSLIIDKKIPIENLPDLQKKELKLKKKRRVYIKFAFGVLFLIVAYALSLLFAFVCHSKSDLSTKILMAMVYEFGFCGYIGTVMLCMYALKKNFFKLSRKISCM